MYQFTVRFRCVRDIQEFVNLATTIPFKMLVGTDLFRVNATSFMGIFAMNCLRPLTVSTDCSEDAFEDLKKIFAKFIEA